MDDGKTQVNAGSFLRLAEGLILLKDFKLIKEVT